MSQLLNGIHRISDRLSRHEAVHNVPGDGQPLGGAPQAFAPAGGQDRRARDPVEKLSHHSLSMCG
jgi:hypothetical protein